jgi:type 1 glutamine amidotransferase
MNAHRFGCGLALLSAALAPAIDSAEAAEAGSLVGAAADELPAHRQEAIRQAAPAASRVPPRAPRRVLIWVTPAHLMEEDPHQGYCLPYGTCALTALGEKSGAFTPVVSNDQTILLPQALRQFDAIVLWNAAGPWITPAPDTLPAFRARVGDAQATVESVEAILRKSFLDFVSAGGGVVGLHFAIAGNPGWSEFHELLGGTFAGHPWNEEVGIRVEEPSHPLLAAFGGRDFRLADEIYQFGKPYTREAVRVLLSLDTERTNMGVPWIERPDNDFAQAWVRSHGQSRVFYTGFGHRAEVFTNPALLQFLLDGIQFACGDLAAPTAPRPGRLALRAPGPTSAEVLAAKLREHGVRRPDAEEIERMELAAPVGPPARPAKPRRVLVWGHAWTHSPNPFAEAALAVLGKKTGAFEAVTSDDPRLLLPDRLRAFDALLLNNIHEPGPFLPADYAARSAEAQQAARAFDGAVKRSILEFVAGGRGIVGIHASNCALQSWTEYGEMMGGSFGGYILDDLVIRPEDPAHPVAACLEGKPWTLRDEIYIFTGAYSRKALRVLLSLDAERMGFPREVQLPAAGLEQGRADRDHAVSWVRSWGQGRVFYTALGHEPSTYWDPLFLRHLLAGLQYAIGDLAGEATPSGE